jgi:IMP cyclohydrolase
MKVSEATRKIALMNLGRLSVNPYPGRGIVIGTSTDGLHAVQIYWIMGRSETSRNRVFSFEVGRLFTEAANPAKVKDPTGLTIYNAMDERNGESFVVSNGDQTDTVTEAIEQNQWCYLQEALCSRKYEPDAPNFTPRITGMSWIGDGGICGSELAIIRKSSLFSEDGACEHIYYEYGEISPGYGFCLTTYNGDGNPLPAFTGEPYLLLIEGDLQGVAEDYWKLLNPDNRVSLAVKFINLARRESELTIINQYDKVAATA